MLIISDFRLLLGLHNHTVVCLFVCVTRLCIVLKRQNISTRFLLHKTVSCLSQIVLKYGYHQPTLSSPNFGLK